MSKTSEFPINVLEKKIILGMPKCFGHGLENGEIQ
jgi:hypothetical protein